MIGIVVWISGRDAGPNVCVYVICLPTLLAPMTATRNPQRHTQRHWMLQAAGCTHTHTSHGAHLCHRCSLPALHGVHPGAREAFPPSACVYQTQCFYQFFLLLTVHHAAYLAGLQFPGRAAPVSARVHGALRSPEGQWEGCGPTRPPALSQGDWSVGLTVGAMSYFRANKTSDKCDSCCSVRWMSRWVHTTFKSRSKCEMYSLSVGPE